LISYGLVLSEKIDQNQIYNGVDFGMMIYVTTSNDKY